MGIPIPAFGSWATEANYPPGGDTWSGQPTKVQPVGDLFTPKTKPPAENLNFLFALIAATFANQADFASTIAVANWNQWTGNPQGVTSANTSYLSSACWDGFYDQWLVGSVDVNSGNTPCLLASVDGGKTWQSTLIAGGFGGRSIDQTPQYQPIAMAVDPIGGNLCSLAKLSSGSGAKMTQCLPGGGSTVPTAQPFLANANIATMWAYDEAFIVVALDAGTGAYNGIFGASSSGGAGLWLDGTLSLPSTWQTGTSNIAFLLNAWNEQPNSNIQIVFGMAGKTPSDVSRLMLSDASAITDITPSVLTGKALRGLAYSALDGLWGIVCFDGSTSYLYTSPDLTTWTLAQTFTTAGGVKLFASGLATVGRVWATCTMAYGIPDPGNRIMYSVNVAAGADSTWSGANYFDPYRIDALETSLGSHALLLSSGNQMLRLQTGMSTFSSGPGSGGGSVAISLKVGTDDQVVSQAPAGIAPAAGGAAPPPIRFAINSGAATFESSTSIPPGFIVKRVSVDIRTPFTGGAPTIEIGQPGTPSLLVPTGVLDSSLGTAGVYNELVDADWGNTNFPVLVTIGGSPTGGAGFVLIEYAQPTG